MKKPEIESIIYRREEATLPIVRRFLTHFPGARHAAFSSEDERAAALDYSRNKGIDTKNVILLDSFKGRLVQKCPATKGMICCNYRLINSGFNCLYRCTYCYLQSYLNTYGILLFTNEEEILRGCRDFLSTADPDFFYRVGTGEFTDSLMLDDLTGLSRSFIDIFSAHRNIFLELKTKSDNILHLLSIPNKGNTVIAWSVNTDSMIARYEQGAASLYDRIAAAVKAAESGYWIAFHFDPVIIYDGWQNEYRIAVAAIFDNVPAEKILWISLGGFRYAPQFRDIMRDNFPGETISDGEFVPCPDGKMRYPKPLRREIYTIMKGLIEERSNDPFIYMCMESVDMWDAVFGRDYSDSVDLEKEFSIFLKNKLS
jgi:spore photoproduct lyase